MIRILTIIGLAISIGLFAYGAIPLTLSFFVPMKTTFVWYQTVGVFILGGAILGIISSNLNKIVGLFKKETIQVETKTKIKVQPAQVVLDEHKLADLEALNHLSQRLSAAEDNEGLELCRKLQDRVFNLHHGKKEATSSG